MCIRDSAKAAKQGKRRTDNKVFKELAAKNVRKSAKDYLIYFFTIAFGVCLFYTFNSISTQFAMLQVDDRLNFLTFTSGMMAAISILVLSLIHIWLRENLSQSWDRRDRERAPCSTAFHAIFLLTTEKSPWVVRS